MRALLAIVAALLPVVLYGAEVQYPPVVPGYRVELPHDEGSHPQFKTEWWYLTGWLETDAGEPLGFQLTFFRSRPGTDEDNPSRFALRQVLFAHAAISDPRRGSLVRHEKSAREGFGLAAAAEGSLDVHIDDWLLRRDVDGYRAVAIAPEFAIDLRLRSGAPVLLEGDQGFSRKGPNPLAASYYYSLPHLQVSGRVVVDGREQRVRGVAWFDHEWSSEILSEQARGWDWLGLNLDDGGALMAFRIRDAQGQKYWAAATWRAVGEGPVSYSVADVEWTSLRDWRSQRTGIRYPVEWKVRIGPRTVTLRPLMDDQENDARGSTGTIYWEGAVRAFDEQSRPLGRGYLELTGYGEKVRF